jgi:hypothetical protein
VALKTLIDKDAVVAPYQIAQVYALRSNAKETFAWLERAWSNRDPRTTTLLRPLHPARQGRPRFAAFCKKVGLPTPAEVGKRTWVSAIPHKTQKLRRAFGSRELARKM